MGKKAPFVVFGAGEKADKAVIAAKSRIGEGFEVHICQTDKEHDFGSKEKEIVRDVSGEYVTFYFTRKESLRAMIDVLRNTLQLWEKEEQERKK